MATLQFAPWSSDIEIPFYAALANRKIDHDKLDDAARRVLGRYEVRPGDLPERSAQMQLHGNAFTTNGLPIDNYRAEGTLKNTNTIEEYKTLDRTKIIEQAGRTIWDAINDGSIFSCPSLLSSFYAIFYADLKKYKFTYHFAFPALHSSPQWKLHLPGTGEPARLSAAETPLLVDAYQTWKYSVDPRQHGFFLAKRDRSSPTSPSDTQGDDDSRRNSFDRPDNSRAASASQMGFQWSIAPLSAYENGFFNNTDAADRFVAFADPSTYPQNPCWMLRNLLVLVRQRWKLSDVQILCYRDRHFRREVPASIILHLKTEEPIAPAAPAEMPKVTGWERNEHNKLNSRTVSLAEYLDPAHLASQSVDLNLKLMKWRIAPDLDLSAISRTKCLLLGAGTLGSYVARNLLGWGVRHITFVDSGRVSYSNPVRQPLFEFLDCQNGGRFKAERAAEKLREIYPGVTAAGHVLSVPMAGHPVMDADKTQADYEKLQRLVEEHDAVFLLLDTREARWLPTLLGKLHRKIVLNAALGFDSYVVMRHGGRMPYSPVSVDAANAAVQQEGVDEPEALGCYFCNDVVAPADSLKDQTLDQQCTVTRPAAAPIASALLVELLISLLQHPLRAYAPAPASKLAPRSPLSHPLGLIPHSIRGFLASWDTVPLRSPAYAYCSACADAVLAGVERGGWAFVRRCLEEKGFVERVSGLDEQQRIAEEAARRMEEELEHDFEGGLDEDGELL